MGILWVNENSTRALGYDDLLRECRLNNPQIPNGVSRIEDEESRLAAFLRRDPLAHTIRGVLLVGHVVEDEVAVAHFLLVVGNLASVSPGVRSGTSVAHLLVRQIVAKDA